MIEVVSIRFKNRGKSYFFDPRGLRVNTGDQVIVETAKGMEIAEVGQGNHAVEETAVVQPLRPVIRIATADDLRVAELNKKREKDALVICQKKIAEHGLEMKLVDAECNFEGTKTTFFFTADGRVDFRELVKDLAGIFRNRIELRQIGVRDEAKMIGGIGICGRPYCCSQFLEDFQPVSTKMAKVQSLSLNPTKISGSCGRLMCCLRYEQAAYEDLLKKVPRQGAFVETLDGYGTAMQVNLLRQTVKVKLDKDSDDTLHLYKSNEVAAVPGGRPKEGVEPPHVLEYVPPEPEEEEPADDWSVPLLVVPEQVSPAPAEGEDGAKRSRRGRRKGKGEARSAEAPREKEDKAQSAHKVLPQAETPEKPAKSGASGQKSRRGKTRKLEVRPAEGGGKQKEAEKEKSEKPKTEKPKTEKPKAEKPKAEGKARSSRYRGHRRPKTPKSGENRGE